MFCQVLAGIRNFSSCIGTTTVTVAVYDASETEIFKQDLKVIVKKNATDVTVTGIADGDSFKVGQTVDVTLPRAGVDTDARELTVDKADNVELKAGEKARTWTVKFVKAGDVTFTARAYQSAKYPATIVKKEIKVSVTNPAPTAAKVVASNIYELTFDTDVEAAGLFKDAKEIANDACYYMLSETKVTFSAVKEVKAKGNTVKVTMYDNFAADTDYFVVINGCDPLSFKIAGTGAKDVDSVAILTDTVVYQTAAEIKIALYNKDGVDIYESVKASGALNISLSTTNLNSYVDGTTLNMYNIGDVTDLTATFTYYDANNNYQAVSKSATKKITAIDAASMVYTGIVYSIDGTGNEASQWYNNAKSYMAIGDDGYAFKASVKYTLNGVAGEVKVNNANQFNNHTLYAKVPEEAVALIQDPAVAGSTLYPIVANTEGRTNVFVGYYEVDNDRTSKFITLAVAPIEIKAKRYPAALTVKPSKSNLNTTTPLPGGNDSVKFEAEIKDQYGDYIDAPLKYTQNKQSEDAAVLNKGILWGGNGGTGKFALPINPGDIGAYANGNSANIVVSFKVDRGDSKAPEVSASFSAKNAGNQNLASDKVDFVNNGATSLETTITSTTALKAVKLQAQTSNNGFYTGKVAIDNFTDTAPSKTNVATGAGVHYELVIKKDGAAVDPTDFKNLTGFLTVTTGTGYIQLDNFKGYDTTGGTDGFVADSAAGNFVQKLPTGQYVFTIYKVKEAATAANTVISSQSVVVNVSDKQENPTFKQLSEAATAIGTIPDCFEFAFGGKNDYVGNFAGAYNGTDRVTVASNATGNWFVNSAEVTVVFKLQNQAGNWSSQEVKFNLESTIKKLIKSK